MNLPNLTEINRLEKNFISLRPNVKNKKIFSKNKIELGKRVIMVKDH